MAAPTSARPDGGPGRGLFLLGTGTDVGKTYVSGLILKTLRQGGRSAAYYKAAMSGNARRPDGSLLPGDALHVREVSGIDQPLEEMCPYVYQAAVSPHLAARWEGDPVELERVLAGYQAVRGKYDYVTVEGSGGILCPLRRDADRELWLADVIRACGLGCLLVTDAGLGTINAVGLTAFYLREQGIPLRGILFNRYRPGDGMQEDNIQVCRELTGVETIATLETGGARLSLRLEELTALYM